MEWHYKNAHSHTTTPYPPLPLHDFHSISAAPLHPLPTLTPHSGLGIAHSTGTDKLCHSVSHYFIHTKVKRGADTAWCHSKLGPSSTSSPAGEGEDERGCLSRDDDAAGGVSKRRRLETGQTLKAAKVWPCLGPASSLGRRVKRQRGARRRRATLSLSNGGGSSTLSIKTPGTLSSSWVLKIDHPRELQLGPYPPLGKCRPFSRVRWEWIRLSLEPLRLSHATE